MRQDTATLSETTRRAEALPAVKGRWRPALLHLTGSVLVAALPTLLLVHLWYPAPYGQLAGGLELFAVLVFVDAVLGPALTCVVASPGKALAAFTRDVAVILTLQLAAFGYGLYTLAMARPVGLVFEVDHMRVISAADVEPSLLSEAPSELRSLSWHGPRTFAAVKPTDPNELFVAIQLGFNGIDLAMLPKQWRTYASQQDSVWRAASSMESVTLPNPRVRARLDEMATAASAKTGELRYLPVVSRKSEDEWIAVFAAPDARVVGLLRLGGLN